MSCDRLYGTAMRVRGAKIPLFSYLLSPLRVPEGPQRFGMGPRNQHDGYRLMARRDGSRVRLFTRRGYDWSGKHSWIVAALRSPRVRSIIVDGEAVWAGKDGKSDFDKLHCRHVHWRRQSLPSK